MQTPFTKRTNSTGKGRLITKHKEKEKNDEDTKRI